MTTSTFTVGDMVTAMKRVVERHLISQKDREVLLALDERSWLQLAFGAMLVATRKTGEETIWPPPGAM